jgi:hypothetical protein
LKTYRVKETVEVVRWLYVEAETPEDAESMIEDMDGYWDSDDVTDEHVIKTHWDSLEVVSKGSVDGTDSK